MSDVATKLRVSIPCGACVATIRLGENRCSNCGRSATSDEMAALQRRWEAAAPEAARQADQIHLSRALIAVVGGLSAVWGLFLWGVIDFATAAFQLIVAAVFAMLFATSFRWALLSTIGAAVFFLFAWTIQLVLNPLMAASFVLAKALTLAGLISGCVAEIHMRRARRALMPQNDPPAMAG